MCLQVNYKVFSSAFADCDIRLHFDGKFTVPFLFQLRRSIRDNGSSKTNDLVKDTLRIDGNLENTVKMVC